MLRQQAVEQAAQGAHVRHARLLAFGVVHHVSHHAVEDARHIDTLQRIHRLKPPFNQSPTTKDSETKTKHANDSMDTCR